jgi:hypothetical protein
MPESAVPSDTTALSEYEALRATIRTRGTARVGLFVAGLSIWAALAVTLMLTPTPSVSTVIPLVVLVGTFEAVFALHVGVERIGRYLQVFYSDRWEETAMAFGPPLAGTGSDPLFAWIFVLAILCNLFAALAHGVSPLAATFLAAFHALAAGRIRNAKQAAGKQRAADLERFRALANLRNPGAEPGGLEVTSAPAQP